MMSKMITCVPGLLVKRGNPCISPTQSPLPHIIESYRTNDDGDIVFDEHKPNLVDYPEYQFVIQMFIDKHMVGE